MKAISATLIKEAEKLATDSAWLTLIELSVNPQTTRYFVVNHGPVTFAGHYYEAVNCKIEDVSTDSRGALNEVEVSVSNVGREMSSYLELYDLRGRRVRLTGVNSSSLADANNILFEEDYEIAGMSVTEKVVTFRLGHARVMEHRFPARRYLRENCQWLYNIPAGRGVECGYVDGFAGEGTVSSTGVTVNGTSTKFMTRFAIGDTITAAAQTRIVATITTDILMTVTIAPSPAWSGATYTVNKPTCDKVLEGGNGCRAHKNQGRFGGFPALPAIAGRFT